MKITYPPELPVSQRRDDIIAALRGNQVVVVAGETGSGKTTQLPKICLELGRGSSGLIGHTQPRRIAARSVAERLSEELGVQLGEEVGYQVRFTDHTSARSAIKVMTDGILLAELQHDPQLRKYDTLIIDEAHERSLNIDFILGYLKRLLPKRPDLMVIITSATIDVDRFSEHFNNAPVIEVTGRTYPVEVRYRPLTEVPDDLDEEGEVVVRDQTEAILEAVKELCAEGTGDILVFLPGEREIKDVAEALGNLSEGPANSRGGFDIVPLYSRLSAAEQHRVFAAHTRRRVVLATNVAETSLTVPGVRYVIDSGLARISRYSVRTKVQRLPIEPVSKASANQRAGRCGRVGPGIAIRLYDEADFEARPDFTEPEILRTNLASVILQMAALRLGEMARFPFVEPPDSRNIKAGQQTLQELAALSSAGHITRLGRTLARLPIDPRLGRMVVEADRLGCLREVLVIVAALSIQDPRERPVEHRARADQLHARFKDPRSDFIGWLNLWQHVRTQQRELSSSAFRRMCKEEHLNYLRIREWQELETQIRQVARQSRLRPGHPADTPDGDAIHQALLSGLLSHIGLRDERRKEYLGARNAKFSIFPGSALHRSQPDFVMAGELVETSRLWGRQVAAINPAWAERLGAHLVKRQWSEPHWSRKRAQVMAYERVTLFGVPLVAQRLASFAQHDPELARELFIRHALVQGEWHNQHRFTEENRRLLDEAQELEHRARRRGIVVDEGTLFDFYDAKVPAEVVSGSHFDSWWRKTRRSQPDLLTFDPAMLVREGVGPTAAQFPSTWTQGTWDLTLSYHFSPGDERDGVTLDVPLATLNQVSEADFSWHVPGVREELVIALIRSLPKHLRVSFVPVPDMARRFLADVTPGHEPLTTALSSYLRSRTGVHVPADAWNYEAVPAHLRPRYRVIDGEGEVVATGRDLEALKAPLRASFEQAVAHVAQHAGITSSAQRHWAFGTLEPTFRQVRAGHEVLGFPALDDEGDGVGVVIATSVDEQSARHRLGVRRLLAINTPAPDLASGLSNTEKLVLAGSPYSSVGELLDDCVLNALDTAELADVRDEAAFDRALARARSEVSERSNQVLRLVIDILAAWREVDKALSGRAEMVELPARTDMARQLSGLIKPGFIAEAGSALVHYPRYLAALKLRAQRLSGQVAKDRELMDRISPLQSAWSHRVEDAAVVGAGMTQVRWLLEEYRVSLWAQQLGTPIKVSDQRIRALLDA